MSNTSSLQAGKNSMPEMRVKIVGSKYIRYRVDEPEKIQTTTEEDVVSQIMKNFSNLNDLKSLRQSFQRRDQASCGFLPPTEFQAVCISHGAPISLPLLNAIVNNNIFCNEGKIRWEAIVDLLHKTTDSHVKHTGRKREDAPAVVEGSNDGNQHKPEDLPKETLSTNCLNWDSVQCQPQRNSRPVSEPVLYHSEQSSPIDQESWIDRFKKLENALRLCQIENSGMVEKERAKCLIHNYNLIYNLSISPLKIIEALQKFSSGQNTQLDPILLYLKEL